MIYQDDFHIDLPFEVEQIIEILEHSGYDAWLVGGAVRDSILGRHFNDYDIATSSSVEKTTLLLESAGYIIRPTGIKHGTVTAIKNNQAVEVTRFRTDGIYLDNRHPDKVTFVKTIEEDLKRRDFTINALAYHPRRGLLDCYGGIQDLDNHVIRAIDDPPTRFREDALRIMRAMRFASQLGFSIEEETYQAMCRHKMRLLSISKERIRKEIELLLLGPSCCKALLESATILCAVLPEITPSIGFEQHTPYHIYDVWEHTTHVIEKTPPDIITRLAALFHDSGKPASNYKTGERSHFFHHEYISIILASHALNRLGWSKKHINKILFLVKHHDVQIEANPSSLCKTLHELGCDLDLFRKLASLKIADARSQSPLGKDRLNNAYALQRCADQIEEEGLIYSIAQLCIKGEDLIELGIEPGPKIKIILELLLQKVMDGHIANNKEDLLNAIACFNSFDLQG